MPLSMSGAAAQVVTSSNPKNSMLAASIENFTGFTARIDLSIAVP
jgi:hypothetical protein